MSKTTKYLSQAALIAAIYVILCFIFSPISFSAVQVRIAEAMCVMPYFTPAGIPGVTIGCLLANILMGANIFDIIFGTLATLIGAAFAYLIRKHRYLVPLPTIISNTLIIPFVLKYAYAEALPIFLLMLSIAAGELISCGALGILLLKVLGRPAFRSVWE